MSDEQQSDRRIQAAIEETLSQLSDGEWRALSARVRPPAEPIGGPISQARSESLARQAALGAKFQQLLGVPKTVDGYTRPPATPQPEPQPAPEPPAAQGFTQGFTANRGQNFAGNSVVPPAQHQSVRHSIGDKLNQFFERTQQQ